MFTTNSQLGHQEVRGKAVFAGVSDSRYIPHASTTMSESRSKISIIKDVARSLPFWTIASFETCATAIAATNAQWLQPGLVRTCPHQGLEAWNSAASSLVVGYIA